jgi:phosphoribosylformimino-5-aminoimidazole carboxamide ribotide isomerase
VSQQSESSFTIYPAIDLRGGRVVRLRQGDFDREQVYAEDPAGTASSFAAAGACWLHVVDLDGAVAGEPRQGAAVASILESVSQSGRADPDRAVRVEVAGGIRTAATVAAAIQAGASRVVLGTAALRDPRWVATMVERHGSAWIAVALDVRNGEAVGDGWRAGAIGVPAREAMTDLEAAGVRTFIVTAIERDGLLSGPDLALLETLAHRTKADLIASGGIASLDDLRAVREIGCRGAVIGRALYDGTIDLAEALAAVK